VQDTFGNRRVKLPAGDAVLYPGTSVHEVTPVTRGARLASFFWIESMVRSDERRRLLFDLDMNLLRLRERHGETAEATALTGIYHNLLRQWAST
jgi:PKHD-type hydroxylase